ncbi:MAG TPA: hypothetical protein PKM56_12055, partial [Candidatus Rifleibacterium sp.]|nr:hypothetical protein [Candidatus Rifleibacterium sp.]
GVLDKRRLCNRLTCRNQHLEIIKFSFALFSNNCLYQFFFRCDKVTQTKQQTEGCGNSSGLPAWLSATPWLLLMP